MSSVTVDPPMPASAGPVAANAPQIGASEDLALFHHTLARVCRNGAPLGGVLADLARELGERRWRTFARELADDLEQGVPLTEAYRARGAGLLPATYPELLEAGMACHDLAGVLDDLGTDARMRAAAQARIRRALARPLVSALAVFGIGAAAFWWVGGDLERLQGSSEGLLGQTSSGTAVLPTSDSKVSAALHLAAPMFAGCVLLAVLALTFWGRPLDGSAGTRSWRLRLPLWGSMRLLAAKASFARTLGLLLRRAMPLPQALSLTAAATDDRVLRRQVERMAAEADAGANLRQALEPGAMLPDSMLWFLEGNHDDPGRGLDDVARVYDQRLDRSIERTALWLAPMLELLLGVAVLLFALRLLAPTYDSVRWIMGW